jgi:flagellar capping protein FliD
MVEMKHMTRLEAAAYHLQDVRVENDKAVEKTKSLNAELKQMDDERDKRQEKLRAAFDELQAAVGEYYDKCQANR